MESIVIPDNVTSIGAVAFASCSRLTAAKIGKGVTTIGNSAFYECSSLEFINIPDNVTTIDDGAFYKCGSLKDIIIPDNVTTIGAVAFGYCSGLTSVKIGKGVTAIGDGAFAGTDISTVISLIKNPFNVSEPFSAKTYINATLYVPVGTKEKYEATDGWKDFLYIEELTNDISQIPSRSMQIQSQDGIITVSGVDHGSKISVYDASGKMVGSTKVKDNQASLATNIKKGEVAIIKIGEKTMKIVMQ